MHLYVHLSSIKEGNRGNINLLVAKWSYCADTWISELRKRAMVGVISAGFSACRRHLMPRKWVRSPRVDISRRDESSDKETLSNANIRRSEKEKSTNMDSKWNQHASRKTEEYSLEKAK